MVLARDDSGKTRQERRSATKLHERAEAHARFEGRHRGAEARLVKIMSTIDESQRKAARVAGFTYLFTFAIVVFSNFAIHDRLNVAGNAAATAQNILAHETLFRIGIACD